MPAAFFVFAIILIISSIAQNNIRKNQKRIQQASNQQKRTHPAFETVDTLPEDLRSVPRKAHQPSISHTVKPLTESTHAHTESSITGFSECDPDEYAQPLDLSDNEDHAEDIDSAPVSRGFALEFDVQNVRNGILYSEILGKPKALKR